MKAFERVVFIYVTIRLMSFRALRVALRTLRSSCISTTSIPISILLPFLPNFACVIQMATHARIRLNDPPYYDDFDFVDPPDLNLYDPEDAPRDPWEQLPTVRMDLNEYLGYIGTLIDKNHPRLYNDVAPTERERKNLFVQALITGKIVTERPDKHAVQADLTYGNTRVILTPSQGFPLANPATTTCTRDIDSLIGRHHDLPFTTSLEFFPVPSFRDTLKSSNHVNIKIRSNVRLSTNSYPTIY